MHEQAEKVEATLFLVASTREDLTLVLRELESKLMGGIWTNSATLEEATSLPAQIKPMSLLRTIVSALSLFDPDGRDNSSDANLRKSIRLTARIPTIIAAIERLRIGENPLPNDPSLSHAANFLYTMTGRVPNDLEAKAMDAALILQADHELNASTFAARVTISTLSDMYAAVTTGIGTLAGPLHGGANEAVMNMLIDIGSPAHIADYIHGLFAQKKKIMGFGHRVYKTDDPRAGVLRRMSQELGEAHGNTKWFEMSQQIEKIVLEEKKLHCNVDFYSASCLYSIGVPTDMFTPVFAASRVTGWTAHAMEQLSDNRIIRPRAEYEGKLDLKVKPIEERD